MPTQDRVPRAEQDGQPHRARPERRRTAARPRRHALPPPGASKPTRGQGTFIDDKEVRDSVKLVKSMAEAQYEPELVQIKARRHVDDEAAKDDAVRRRRPRRAGNQARQRQPAAAPPDDRLRPREPPRSKRWPPPASSATTRAARPASRSITIEEWEAMKAAAGRRTRRRG